MQTTRLAHLYASWQAVPDAQENIRNLLQILNEEQAHPYPGFPEGFFYCERWHPLLYRRPDHNVFIQALSAFALQRAAERVENLELKRDILAVKDRITAQYGRFRSFVGLDTYGFWPLRPRREYFPYGTRLHRDEFFRPPDDADDTVVIYLSSWQTQEAKRWLHEVKLPQHANRPAKRVRNSFRDWQETAAYTTFFADAMPSGFDVSVMANILYWIFEEGFALNEHDEATVQLVEDAILSGKLLSNPYRCSPYYPSAANIFYNLARVVGRHPRQFRAELPRVLWQTGEKLYPGLHHPMEELLVRMGMAFLGEGNFFTSPHPGWYQAALADSSFSFFALPLAQEYDLRLAKLLSPRQYLHIRFQCLGFHAATLIEYFSLGLKY